MQLKVLTVSFGGEWKLEDDCCAYVGDLTHKAFVIQDNMELDVMRERIMDRFKINPTTFDISLAHLHPSQKLKNPYMVDTQEDFISFLDINEAVSWKLLLYVSLSKKTSENRLVTDEVQNSQVRLQSEESFQGAIVVRNDMDVDCVDREIVQNPGDSNIDSVDKNQSEIQREMVQSSGEDELLALPGDGNDLHVDCADKNHPEIQPETVQSCAEGDHLAPPGHSDSLQVDGVEGNQSEIVQSSEEKGVNHLSFSEDNDFLHVGQLFKSKQELIDAVRSMAMRENFDYRVKKSSNELYRLTCVDAKCTWKLRAIILKGTNYFEIRKFSHQHTCPSDARCAKRPSYRIVGEKLKTRYVGVSKGPTLKMIMQNELDQNVSYWKAWKAQEWVRNSMQGTPEENYAMLPAFCHMLEQVNHGTYTCLEIDNYNRFKYVFISIGASIKGFQLLRKVIMVDAISLNGKYERNLMIATAQDGNQEIYPLAFAVVDSEDDSSWMWFFQELLNVIPCSNDLVFVSDQNLSISKAVESVYISAKHVICTRQLKEDLKSRFKGKGVLKFFIRAAESYTIKGFEEYFQNLCNINSDMGKYLRDANFEKWSRAHCPSDRYNIMTSNDSESIDSFLKEARSYPIVALLEHITDTLSRWFTERREKAEKNNNELPPNVGKILDERYERLSMYAVKMLSNNRCEVVGGTFRGVVDLSQRTCSCKVFDLDHIPCAHAIAAIEHMKCNVADYVGEYYQFHSWFMTYEETIHSLPEKSLWVVPEDVTSIECSLPLVGRKKARHGKRKLPSEEDVVGKVTRGRKVVTCSNCGKSGHNRKSCLDNLLAAA